MLDRNDSFHFIWWYNLSLLQLSLFDPIPYKELSPKIRSRKHGRMAAFFIEDMDIYVPNGRWYIDLALLQLG